MNAYVALPSTLDEDRVIDISSSALALGYSVSHTRRMYRTGVLPTPIQIGGRKLGYTVRMIKDIVAGRYKEKS